MWPWVIAKFLLVPAFLCSKDVTNDVLSSAVQGSAPLFSGPLSLPPTLPCWVLITENKPVSTCTLPSPAVHQPVSCLRPGPHLIQLRWIPSVPERAGGDMWKPSLDQWSICEDGSWGGGAPDIGFIFLSSGCYWDKRKKGNKYLLRSYIY